jgi:hypothetical protein
MKHQEHMAHATSGLGQYQVQEVLTNSRLHFLRCLFTLFVFTMQPSLVVVKAFSVAAAGNIVSVRLFGVSSMAE